MAGNRETQQRDDKNRQAKTYPMNKPCEVTRFLARY